MWSASVRGLRPETSSYVYMVDGAPTMDQRNPGAKVGPRGNSNRFDMPGSPEFYADQKVPHGKVEMNWYPSAVLNETRPLWIYTPPGYELGKGKYPIFYLLHGAGDCDEAWTSVGRAGFILDNLIAAKTIKPMVVVMPAGHTTASMGGGRGAAPAAGGAPVQPPVLDEFAQDFLTDIMPYAETHYRVLADRANRAIAGLSMGGSQTLNIAFLHLDKFAYIGVFSSGATLGGGGRGAAPAAAAPTPPAGPSAWETAHKDSLDNAALKKGTKLIWLSTGADDGLLPNTKATVEMLKKHGFNPVFKQSTGAHTWINWRNYLNEFATQLFQ